MTGEARVYSITRYEGNSLENRRITFEANGATCEGVLACPDEMIHAPGVVVCHPHPLHGGDMQNAVVRCLAEAFVKTGFAVLRFNFRGVGQSTGQYDEGIGEQEDAKAALGWLGAQPGVNPDQLFLAGYSFGARVTLAVASSDPRVCGFVVVAPPVRRGGWPHLESTRGPKIFLCGDQDPHVPIEVLSALIDALPMPKRLLVFPDTDHFFVGQERALGQCAASVLQECLLPTSR
jgi:alpha/beta superfamily hydrolase